jgi:hypothetical protein
MNLGGERWKSLERHPLSALYEDLAGWEYDDLKAGIDEHGILGERKVTLYESQVLDGWQFYRACLELNVKPEFGELAQGIRADDFIKCMNDHRRHETVDVRQSRRQKRIERVAAMRAEGHSVRVIAEQAGITKSQVQRDLETAQELQTAVVPDGTTETTPPNSTTATATPTSEESVNDHAQGFSAPKQRSARVKGRDGKSYSAQKPKILCDRCARVGVTANCAKCQELRATKAKPSKNSTSKNGKPDFDDRVIGELMGKLARAFNERHKAIGGKEEFKEVRQEWDHLNAAWKRWQLRKEKVK